MANTRPGNVFAGATLPYGMAKASADTNSPSNQGGFTTDGYNVTGFSSMHDSGTGSGFLPSIGEHDALIPPQKLPIAWKFPTLSVRELHQ